MLTNHLKFRIQRNSKFLSKDRLHIIGIHHESTATTGSFINGMNWGAVTVVSKRQDVYKIEVQFDEIE